MGRIPGTNIPELKKTPRLSEQVASFIILQSHGEPSTALSAMCEVVAELIKVGGPQAAPKLRDTFIQHLDRFLKIPNSLIDVKFMDVH